MFYCSIYQVLSLSKKEISPEYSLEGLMLKLKLQYYGHLMQKTDSFEKTLMLGMIEGRKRRGQQRMRWLYGTTDLMDMNLSKFQELIGDGQGSPAYCSPWGHRELDYKESLAPKNWCLWTVGLEKTLKSPLECKEIQPVHPKENQSWIFFGRNDAEAETPTVWPPDAELSHLKRPWCWERLKAGGKGDGRGDGWMASSTQWTWIWVSSRSAGKPGVLQSMGLQRVIHNRGT